MTTHALTIRDAQLSDAEKLAPLGQKLAGETPFLTRKPHEMAQDETAAMDLIMGFNQYPGWHMLIAFIGEHPVGQVTMIAGLTERTRHTATIGVAVLKDFQGNGIGARLMKAAETFALDDGISRLELTVMTHNHPAIALYRKMGYNQEGIKKRSILLEDHYQDELMMARILTKS